MCLYIFTLDFHTGEENSSLQAHFYKKYVVNLFTRSIVAQFDVEEKRCGREEGMSKCA